MAERGKDRAEGLPRNRSSLPCRTRRECRPTGGGRKGWQTVDMHAGALC